MRYHQVRTLRQHDTFIRNCKICGGVLVVLVVALAIGG